VLFLFFFMVGWGVTLREKKRMGRPLVFDAAAQAKFLEGISLGIPRVRCAHLAGVSWPTAESYIHRHPEFQQTLDTAEAEAESYFASAVKRAAGKDHPIAALAWLGRRRPGDWAERGRVEHGHAHLHAATPSLAAALSGLNLADLTHTPPQVIDCQSSVASKRIGQGQARKARKHRRYSKRPTPPRPPALPPPPSATHIPPLQITDKNKKDCIATATKTNGERDQGTQQAA
jgi:hypothetical protein